MCPFLFQLLQLSNGNINYKEEIIYNILLSSVQIQNNSCLNKYKSLACLKSIVYFFCQIKSLIPSKQRSKHMFRIRPSQDSVANRPSHQHGIQNAFSPARVQQQSSMGLNKAPHPNEQQHDPYASNIPPSNAHEQPSVSTCRICLQQGPALHANTQPQLERMLQKLQQESHLKQPRYLIAACRCQGTAGYVHQRCMIQWIEAQLKGNRHKHITCEICLLEILYDKNVGRYLQCTCRNLEDISQCNVASFGSTIVVLAVLVALQAKSEDLSLSMLTKVAIYIFISVVVIASAFSLSSIIKQAFYRQKKSIVKIYTNDQIDILHIQKSHLPHYEVRSSAHRTQSNTRSVRSIRSAQSIRQGGQSERINRQSASRGEQRNHHRSERNILSGHQLNRINAPGSTRHVRVVRQPENTLPIQVRSSQNLENSYLDN